MELRPHNRLVLLYLGIVLGNVLQIVAQETSCNGYQYLSEELNRCCSRCPPGHRLISRCTSSSDTVCQLCGNGTYAANWNSARTCRTCYPCSRGLVEKEPCNSTKDTVCGCPHGQSCTLRNAMDECLICAPNPTTTTPTTEPPPTELPPDSNITWIIIGVVLFVVATTILIICLKTPLLKSFGRLIKNKRPSESIPQVEIPITVDFEVVGTVNGGPASPLLMDGEIKTPLQETEALSFPIQVTDDKEIGEFALSK
ncbi:tumor necrosis factor receptor superfamily member 3 [Leptodactylus fuscus]|uniref:tumor necrosis factor receptor superfamily member 3 n=1 Tax=Leptodactylus fuscus TaxID=238119 RepID=UPI003F4E9E3A